MKDLRHVLAIIWHFKGKVFLSMLLGVAAIAAGIGLMGTSAYLIASAALQPSIADLQVAIVGVRFFGISRGFFRYLERLVSHSVNLRVLSQLRENFYHRVEPGSPQNLAGWRSGDVLQRVIGDLETLENFFVRVISPVIISLVVITGVSLFIGGYALQLGIILALGLVFTGFVQPVVALLISRTRINRLAQSKAENAASMVDYLQGLEDIQAGNAQESFLSRINNEFSQSTRLHNQIVFINSLNSGMTLFFINLTLLVMLWAAIPLVSRGDLTGISLTVISLITLASFEVSQPLPSAALNLNASAAAAARLFAIGGENDEPRNEAGLVPDNSASALLMDQVSFSFEGEAELLLEDISIQVAAGHCIALVGASGAGKSSLVNLLLGFEFPQAGKITIGGVDIQTVSPESTRSFIAVLPQAPYLFDDTLSGNLLLAKMEAEPEELLAALQHADLTDWFDALPEGLDTWVGEHGLKMSGGERQRLAIARVLLQNRPFILLDEPTANLDRSTAVRVMENVLKDRTDKGYLIVTHDLRLLPKMDEIIVLSGGRITQRGTFDELQSAGGEFKKLYEMEMNRLQET